MRSSPEAAPAAIAAPDGPRRFEMRSALATPYVEAELSVDRSREPQDTPLDALTSHVLRVVAIEGPVHEQEIVGRIRAAFGLARTGSRIRTVVMQAIAARQKAGAIVGGPFWSLPGQVARVRIDPRCPQPGCAEPEMLPDTEIEAALLAVIDANYGASREALIVATVRLFGFASTSDALRERMAGVLDGLLERTIVTAQNDLIRRAATAVVEETETASVGGGGVAAPAIADDGASLRRAGRSF